MSAVLEFPSRQSDRTRAAASFLFCGVLAAGLHAGILFAWRYQPQEADLIQVLGGSVEVALVEAASDSLDSALKTSLTALSPVAESPPPAPPRPVPPEAEPFSPTPESASVPADPPPAPFPEAVASVKDDAPVSSPKGVAPSPASRPEGNPPPSTPSQKNVQTAKTTGGAPSRGAPTVAGGDPQGKALEKPLYSVRPQVNYPAGSRAAGEQGVVVLRITVNASGRPTAVSVGISSGFPRLDRAAVEGGWRCRVSNAFEGAQFECPLRFTLK